MDKNKNEMIKDIARRILEDFSNYYSEVDVDAVKIMIGTLIDNLNYRKVADDEIVVKKSEYQALKKDYDEWKDEYDHNCLLRLEVSELEKQLEKAKQETREILQAVLTFVKKGMEIVASGKALANYDLKLVKMLEEYAKKHGIELE